MSTLKLFSGKELIKLLREHNFEVIGVKGSHHFMKHTDGRTTVIPVHNNK
jgi:predicted RNA binding protein YcfA (HicA-like mRNA interferase family)